MPIRPILSLPIPWLPIWPVFLRPSIIRFLPMEEGDFFRLPYVSPGGEGFNTTLQVNRWHVLCTLNGVRCGDKICAPLSSIVAGGVVLCEIVCQIVLSRHPTHHILSLSWWATCASRRLSDSLKKWLQVLLPLRYLGRFKMVIHLHELVHWVAVAWEGPYWYLLMPLWWNDILPLYSLLRDLI